MKTVTEKQDKRQKILAAAIALFSGTHDVKKVSLEDIARQAQVSPTTIYNNYGSREALLAEVVKSLVRENLARNRAIVESDAHFPQKLMAIMGGKLDMAGNLNAEILAKMVSQDDKMGPFIDSIYQAEIKPLWMEILSDGKRQGYVNPALDEEALLVYLDVMKAGFASRPDLTRNLTEKMPLIKELTRIMFYGLLTKEIDLFHKEGK